MHNIKSTSEINYCHEKTNEMFSQLFWSIDKWTYGSWGVSKRMYTFYKDMPTLMLRVSGLMHKGWVFISLDEGTDSYVITLLNTKYVEKKSVDNIFCDTLGETVDELIEKSPKLTDKEYHTRAMKDSERKWNQTVVTA